MDNFMIDGVTKFDFEDIVGWEEVDVGQTLGVVITAIEQVPDIAAVTGVGALERLFPAQYHAVLYRDVHFTPSIRINLLGRSLHTLRHRYSRDHACGLYVYRVHGQNSAAAAKLYR
jgi:hypothetical protein